MRAMCLQDLYIYGDELIKESEMKIVGSMPWSTIYARRTIVGGLAYFSDDVGGGQLVVDMSTVDIDILRYIVDNHERIDKTFDQIRT